MSLTFKYTLIRFRPLSPSRYKTHANEQHAEHRMSLSVYYIHMCPYRSRFFVLPSWAMVNSKQMNIISYSF